MICVPLANDLLTDRTGADKKKRSGADLQSRRPAYETSEPLARLTSLFRLGLRARSPRRQEFQEEYRQRERETAAAARVRRICETNCVVCIVGARVRPPDWLPPVDPVRARPITARGQIATLHNFRQKCRANRKYANTVASLTTTGALTNHRPAGHAARISRQERSREHTPSPQPPSAHLRAERRSRATSERQNRPSWPYDPPDAVNSGARRSLHLLLAGFRGRGGGRGGKGRKSQVPRLEGHDRSRGRRDQRRHLETSATFRRVA